LPGSTKKTHNTAAGKTENEPGYALRFPRLVKFREDKTAEESTSVDEIKKMFNNQFVKKK